MLQCSGRGAQEAIRMACKSPCSAWSFGPSSSVLFQHLRWPAVGYVLPMAGPTFLRQEAAIYCFLAHLSTHCTILPHPLRWPAVEAAR
eukprot:1154444-Pelagomonas_calceolata.AAC.2